MAGRQRSSDVIRNRPGLAPYASSAKTEEDAFSIFFTDELFVVITMYTNKRIEETIQGIIDKDGKMCAQTKVTTNIEVKALIGLMYYRGLYGQNNHRLDMLFSERHGAPVFSATMNAVSIYIGTPLFR